MTLNTFISNVKSGQGVSFDNTIAIIDQFYIYTPTGFSNGLGKNSVSNTAGTNEGSCKIFAFAKLNQLDEEQTVNLFGDYYHEVLNDPDGNGHQNIRKFLQYGWQGIQFHQPDTLSLK